MKRLLLISFFCSIYTLAAFAQDNYYVKGNAKILNPKYHWLFKEDRHEWIPFYELHIRISDSIHVFTVEEVSEYKKDGKLYRRETLSNGTKIFLEVVEEGTLSLYYLVDKDFNKRFFIRKQGELLIEIDEEERSRKNFVKVLRKNWNECKELKRLIDICQFNRTSLKRTIRAHNRCKDFYLPRTKIFFGGGVGLAKPEMSYGIGVNTAAFEGVYRNYQYSFELSYIGELGMSFPLNQSNFSIETGPRFQYMQYSLSTFFSFNQPFDRQFISEISLLDLALPVEVQYTLPYMKYRPFFKVGLSPNFFLQRDNDLTIRRVDLIGNIIEEKLFEEQLKSFGIGFNLAMGIQQQLNDKSELQLTIGYARRGTTQENRIYNFSNFYWTLGYSFYTGKAQETKEKADKRLERKKRKENPELYKRKPPKKKKKKKRRKRRRG